MSEDELIFLCTDMDRTVIPNGQQPESKHARPIFKKLIENANIVLCYVSGRDFNRVLSAIEEFDLPQPKYIISDVGSTIYHMVDGNWEILNEWHIVLKNDWLNLTSDQLSGVIGELANIKLQDKDKQNCYKLSYSATPSNLLQKDIPVIETRLDNIPDEILGEQRTLKYKIITSIDETKDEGLLDILPESSGKYGAIKFLYRFIGFSNDQVYFSGDSGNDKDVILSGVNACVVNNATQAFKQSIIDEIINSDNTNCTQGVDLNGKEFNHVYFARGVDALRLNGNYSAGVTEGLFHYYPALKRHLPEDLQ